MLDTYLSMADFQKEDSEDQSVLLRIAPQLNVPVAELKDLPLEQQWEKIAELADKANGIGIAEIRRLAAACKAHFRALSRYEPRPYAGPCVLFPAGGSRRSRKIAAGKRSVRNCASSRLPGNHYSMLREPHVQVLAERLDRYLQACDAHGVGSSPPSPARDERMVQP